jgi:hypothetical protein
VNRLLSLVSFHLLTFHRIIYPAASPGANFADHHKEKRIASGSPGWYQFPGDVCLEAADDLPRGVSPPWQIIMREIAAR